MTNLYRTNLGLRTVTGNYNRVTGRSANRRMRTRMSGGVGGAGASPAPIRFSTASDPARSVVTEPGCRQLVTGHLIGQVDLGIARIGD